MKSDFASAVRILREDGPVELIKRAHNYYFCNRNLPPRPPKQHLQLLQDEEDLAVAEIGVWKGKNAEYLLDMLDIDKLFLIDPYETYDEYPSKLSDNEQLSASHKMAHSRLDEYANISWIEKFSSEAIGEIDRRLDYVYVDGNHHYEYVKSDIKNYYSLLKEGGMIAGHDANYIGVAQAVTEFAIENELQPHFEAQHSDWYFIKGRSIDTREPLTGSTEANQITKDEHRI